MLNKSQNKSQNKSAQAHLDKINEAKQSLKTKIKFVYKKITAAILNTPERSFFTVLGALFLIIIIGNIIGRFGAKPVETTQSVKKVHFFSIGESPKITATARIEKSGVIKIIAQSGGVVQAIYKNEGANINRGETLMWLSSNNQGGTIPSVNRQIAQNSYSFANDNFAAQVDLINKQRDVADKGKGQADKLRDIANQSIDDTNNLINLNNDIVNSLDNQINALSASDSGSTTAALILQAKTGKAQIESGLLSLKSALRNAQFQSNSDNEPAKLAQDQLDITKSQLDLQEKSLKLSLEVARLNLNVAQIAESFMYPASPLTGVIERIHVQVGQNVNNGAVLATITGNQNHATAIVNVPKSVAQQVSLLEKSVLYINGSQIELTPKYISGEPTENGTNTISYLIPDEYTGKLAQGSSIRIDIPIDAKDSKTTSAVPFIPLDAVYQTQTDAYVFIASPSGQSTYTAKSKTIKLGNVYGAFVEAITGLNNADQIITDRNIVAGDKVTRE
jgi:multidrug efflux pump subunit AcrA (membrane-fusion protein)